MASVDLCGGTVEAIPRSATCVDFSGRPDLDYGSEGWGFESLRARFISPGQTLCTRPDS
jgi:hypothetical protein